MIRGTSKLFATPLHIVSAGIFRTPHAPIFKLPSSPYLRRQSLFQLTEKFGISASIALQQLTHKFPNLSYQSKERYLKIISAPENLLQLQPERALNFEEFREYPDEPPTVKEFERKIFHPIANRLHKTIQKHTNKLERSNAVVIAGSIPLCIAPIFDRSLLPQWRHSQISKLINAHQRRFQAEHPYQSMPLVYIIHPSIMLSYNQTGELLNTHYTLKNNISRIDFKEKSISSSGVRYEYIPIDPNWSADMGREGIIQSILASNVGDFSKLAHGQVQPFQYGSPFFQTPVGVPMNLSICLDVMNPLKHPVKMSVPLQIIVGMGAPVDRADETVLLKDGLMCVFDADPACFREGSVLIRRKIQDGDYEELLNVEIGGFSFDPYLNNQHLNRFSVPGTPAEQFTTIMSDLIIDPNN